MNTNGEIKPYFEIVNKEADKHNVATGKALMPISEMMDDLLIEFRIQLYVQEI